MIKKTCVLLLVLLSFCAAANLELKEPSLLNKATLAYGPYVTNGLHESVLKNVSVYSYAPSTVYDNGVFHQFYCSTGNATDNFFNPRQNKKVYKSFDHIRYRTSKDGSNWSAPRIALTVNKENDDICACDPSVVYGDDGYWYMLYDGNSKDNSVVTYLARSSVIQGPYYKYLGNGRWETEFQSSAKPKFVLYEKDAKNNESAAHQTVVKKNDGFYVWFTDSKKEFRFIHVKKLTDLEDLDFEKTDIVRYRHTWESEATSSFANDFSLGDVRYNEKLGIWEMWCEHGHLSENMNVSVFTSSDKITWVWQNWTIGPYNYIHNVGVSGDKHGSIWGDSYLLSFSGPFPGTDDATVALHKSAAQLKPYGYDFEKMKNPETPLLGLWPMWQQLVGESWTTKTIKYSASGFNFPHNVNTSNIEYFTGDFDGDGVSDLGAVNRSTGRWYLYSVRRQEYISGWDGKELVSGLNGDFEIIAGDYDGDGKTDVGAVNKKTGQWYIYSSITGGAGINQYAPSVPNHIPWGWQWPGMTSSHKIVVGDFDGDGKADRAIYMAPYWFFISSMATVEHVADGLFSMYGFYTPWGWNWSGMQSHHVAVPGDFDGDGITDRAIYGTSDAKWYVLTSRMQENPLTWYWRCKIDGANCEKKEVWGHRFNSDYKNTKPYAGDYDGDGVADLVQVNVSTGKWSIFRSSDGKKNSFDDGSSLQWNRLKNAGNPVILVGDFDGDGKADRAFADKSNRMFYVISSRKKQEGINDTLLSVSANTNTGYFAKEAPNKDEGPEQNVPNAPIVNVSVVERGVSVANVPNGVKIAVFDMNGKMVHSSVSNGSSVNFELQSYGKFVVRAGTASKMIVVK